MSDPPLTGMGSIRWSIVRPVLERQKPSRVLEIGCGQGALGARLAKQALYVGVDSDARSCSVAATRVQPVGGVVVEGTIDDVQDEAPFDLVCAFEVLEHIEDDVGALKSWMSRLTPSGTVIVSVPAWPSRFGAWDAAVGHLRRYTPDDLAGIMSKAGCRDVETVLYGWPVAYVTESLRNLVARRSHQRDPTTNAERTARSGRYLQVGGRTGRVIEQASTELGKLQKLAPGRGVGLVGLGRA